jgi:hypothetical protein
VNRPERNEEWEGGERALDFGAREGITFRLSYEGLAESGGGPLEECGAPREAISGAQLLARFCSPRRAWAQNSDETRRRLIGNALGDLMNLGTVESPCCAAPFGDDSMEIAGRPISQA